VATGAGGGWPLPGLAVHEELALMASAGVSAPAALRAGTGSAIELGRHARPWASGSPADFLVVAGDPSQDPSNISRVTYIVRGGELLTPAELLQNIAPLRRR
jgi:imidazolonepropionase-like amidohydrolase